ncbi:hypothetical protein ACFX13_003780 [Malus domestica]|uniref:Uncharacterized protein n=1 Tax=Malus domestica TaxID=3750 RepID=A0A498IWS9_MALDO|nr:hypothetical protein DVH24_034769 [Malus domestica]
MQDEVVRSFPLFDPTSFLTKKEQSFSRPRKTYKETIRKDMEYLELTEDLAQNRAQCNSRIHTPDPT